MTLLLSGAADDGRGRRLINKSLVAGFRPVLWPIALAVSGLMALNPFVSLIDLFDESWNSFWILLNKNLERLSKRYSSGLGLYQMQEHELGLLVVLKRSTGSAYCPCINGSFLECSASIGRCEPYWGNVTPFKPALRTA